MVEHPASIELDENSSDIELSVDVTEEPIPAATNGVPCKKRSPEFESLSTIDENTISSSENDLNSNSRIIKTVMEEEEFDSVEVEATSCDSVSRSSGKVTLPEKSDNSTDEKTDSCRIKSPVSDASAKVNGFSSKRSRDDNDDDISQDGFECKKLSKCNSSLKKLLDNGTLSHKWQSKSEKIDNLTEGQVLVSEEIEKSSADLPIVDSCDKSIHHSSSEYRVNGDISKLHDDESVSPAVFKRKLIPYSGDSDSGSGSSSHCPEKRLKIDNSGDSSTCLADDSVILNGCSDSENSINSIALNSFPLKKKTTARKSTGGNVVKITARLKGEDYAKEQLAEAETFLTPAENGVDNSTTDSVDTNAPSDAGRQSLVDEGHQSSVNEGRPSPVDEVHSSPVDEERLSPLDEVCQSLVDERKHLIKFDRESMSNESLKNVSKKMVKQLSRRQLEEIVLQKCCEMISESGEIGETKKRIAEYDETENFRKNKTACLERQLFQMKAAAEVFCCKARQVKESGQILLPKIITRSVGLQVDLHTSSESNSPPTRGNSIDEGDQTAAPAVMNSKTSSSTDTGQSSGYSSPTKSPRPSFSKIVNTGKCQKPSLPTDNQCAVNGKNNTTLPVKKNSSSETLANVPPVPSDDVIVDLTDLDDNADSPPRPSSIASRNGLSISRLRQPSELPVSPRHPAPLPPMPKGRTIPGAKLPPPKPNLSIQKNNLAIQMTWDLILNGDFEPIDKYQIYAYQETADVPVSVNLWKLVGDVESLDLPMACTLTQFVNGYKYHFAVRAVDKHGRYGPFSCARSIAL